MSHVRYKNVKLRRLLYEFGRHENIVFKPEEVIRITWGKKNKLQSEQQKGSHETFQNLNIKNKRRKRQ